MRKCSWIALGATVFFGALACSADDEPNTKGPAVGTQAGAGDGTTSVGTGVTSNTAPTDTTGGTSSVGGTGTTGAPLGDGSSPATGTVGTGEPAGTVSAGTSDTAGMASTAMPSSTVTGTMGSVTTTTGTAIPSDSAGGDSGGAGGVPPEGAAGAGGIAVVPGDPPVSEIPGAGMSAGACTLGAGMQEGSGQTLEQYLGADVTRDGRSYRMITNGWGMNWDSHDITWLGSSMSINTYAGSRQDNGAPAGYPSVFCGRYSDTSMDCGLPKALSEVTAINTAVSWSHPMADGTYNVAYDVWLGDGQGGGFRSLQSYFMVWLKDPADESPAGSLLEEGVTIPNAPGVWNIVTGTVNGLPIVNYVRAEGDELHAMAFDVMDFIRDAQMRNLEFPGNDLLAVAIGFEIWQGPVTGLKLDDFCLDIQ